MVNRITKRRKILFFIPFGIVACILVYSWLVFIVTDNVAMFQHYLALALFLPVIFFLVRDKTLKKPIIFTGVYLLLATINILSFFPFVATSSIGVNIGSLKIATPGLNGISLMILILYSILNFDTLVDIYHDYKEAKGEL